MVRCNMTQEMVSFWLNAIGKTEMSPKIHATLIASTLVVSGCASFRPDYTAPSVEAAQSGWVVEAPEALQPGALADSDWWMDFADPVLTALLADADAANFDIAQARAGLAAAEAGLRQARAIRLPLGTVNSDVTRSKTASATFGGNLPFEFDANTTYSLGAGASWEFDLFGRLSNGVSQAEAALGGQEAVTADVSRILLAQTAIVYLTLRELDARLDVNEKALQRQEAILDLTGKLLEAGQVARLDVIRQRQLTDTTRAGLISLRAARADTLSALALLTGRTVPQLLADHPSLDAGAAPEATQRIPGLSTFEFTPLTIGNPADMLRRRPDVRAAERNLASAVYGVGVAKADFFPTLSLTGQVSSTALEVGDLGTEDALGYAFGPRLSWGVFNLPLTRARVAAAEAQVELAAIAYERTVTTALTETDAALANYNFALESAALRNQILSDAVTALGMVEERYRAGADGLISLIDAQREALLASDAATAARFEAMRRRVDVYRALGG